MFQKFGNRITENALNADDGAELITRALRVIQDQHGWAPVDSDPIFTGTYYDSKKVGSKILRVTNNVGEQAALKLQLRPLPYHEGMIIRHVQPQIKTPRIRLPKIIVDQEWSESNGYGYLILEELTHLPHLWDTRPDEYDLDVHEDFLGEFMKNVLPLDSYLPAPTDPPREKYLESLNHFSKIAEASDHHHIDSDVVEQMKHRYQSMIERMKFQAFHFTHGHLSGHEIAHDQSKDQFILFANLMWSFRPPYYELLFPIWVDLMGIRDEGVSISDLRDRIQRWMKLWKNVMSEDLEYQPLFWFGLFERSMMTVMLDLGASDWNESEHDEKLALMHAWKDVFHWVLEDKL